MFAGVVHRVGDGLGGDLVLPFFVGAKFQGKP
jgi:hypothetical protein